MAVITGKVNWPVDNQEVRMRKGKLIRVEIGPGQFRKMYEADAIEKGYIKPKNQPAERDKMLRPQGDKVAGQKSVSVSAETVSAPSDDFTQIPGVGPATARMLVANGITTFDQLRQASSLSFLPERALQAIETWRNARDEAD